MPALSAWIQASRPLAQANIAIPLLVAQAAAWHVEGAFSFSMFAVVLLWGVFDQLFIVFGNDYADRHTDTQERTPVSGGSGVLVDGKISATLLGRAAFSCALGVLACSAWLAALERPWALVGGAVALALLWAYSFPPLRMSDRFGGGLLQGVGVGIGLPWLGYYAQTNVALPPVWLVGPCFMLAMASNLLTSIPDVLTDKQSGKQTWAVRYGVKSTKRATAALIVMGAIGAAVAVPSLYPQQRLVIALLPSVVVLASLRRQEPAVSEMPFVWVGATALNLALVLWGAFMVTR